MGLLDSITRMLHPSGPAPLVPPRRLPMHPLIIERLTTEHDTYGLVVKPAGEYVDLSHMQPVTGTIRVDDSRLDPRWSMLTQNMVKHNGAQIIGAVDRITATTHELLVLLPDGTLVYLEPCHVDGLTLLDQALTAQGKP